MATGKATRIYIVNKTRLAEALRATDKLIQPLRDALKKKREHSPKGNNGEQ